MLEESLTWIWYINHQSLSKESKRKPTFKRQKKAIKIIPVANQMHVKIVTFLVPKDLAFRDIQFPRGFLLF